MPGNALLQSVMRALDLLELAAQSEDGVTLQAMAQRLGVPAPTAHNLARTLAARGYLERRAHPTRYRLGAAPGELLQAQAQRRLVRRAREALRLLQASFPAVTLTLSEVVGCAVTPVLRMSPERAGVLQQGYGQPFCAYTSASGLLYQAYATEAERRAYRERHPFAEYGAHCWGTPYSANGWRSEEHTSELQSTA